MLVGPKDRLTETIECYLSDWLGIQVDSQVFSRHPKSMHPSKDDLKSCCKDKEQPLTSCPETSQLLPRPNILVKSCTVGSLSTKGK